MSVEFANFSLSFTVFLSLGIFLTAINGIYQKKAKLMEIAFSGQIALLILMIFANFAYLRAFIGLDFSVKEVVLGATLEQAVLYRISASLLSPCGSFLFLMLLMTFIGHISFYILKKYDFFLITRTYAVYSLLIFIISSYSVLFANPFLRSINIPEDGIGIDSSLQNGWIIFIPILLNLGYAISAFLFSFTVASLFEKNKKEWEKISFNLTLSCFVIFLAALTLITLWGYNNIAWKAWWSWNSFENSVLTVVIIYLALTLIIHVNITKNCLYKYSIVLSLVSFFFVLFSLFALKTNLFASNYFLIYPLNKPSLLFFFSLPIIIATACFYYTRKLFVKENKDIYLLSHQGLAVIASFSLCTITAIMLFATIFPLLLSLILNSNIKYLSDDFYNFSLAPFVGIIILIIFFSNIFKPNTSFYQLFHNEKITFILSFLVGIVAFLISPHLSIVKTCFFATAVFLCFIALAAITRNLFNKPLNKFSFLILVFQTGFVITILSGILMASYKKNDVFDFYPDKTVSFENAIITLENIETTRNPAYQETIFNFNIRNIANIEQKVVSRLRFHKKLKQISYKSGIYRGITKDIKIYASLLDNNNNIEVYLTSKPFALWLHLGFVIMFLSSFLIFRKILLPK